MSRTPKDRDLDRGRAPERIFVGFAPDPLNRVVYWTAHAYLYAVDAKAECDREVYEYALVPRKDRTP